MRIIPYHRLGPDKGILYSRDHLRRKCRAGTFPMPIQISDRRIAWVEEEIDRWLARRVALRAEVATSEAANDGTATWRLPVQPAQSQPPAPAERAPETRGAASRRRAAYRGPSPPVQAATYPRSAR